MPGTIKTPFCPLCDKPPRLALFRQFLCGNDDCVALCWNPTVDGETLRKEMLEGLDGKTDEFTCELCGGTFDSDTTEEEAIEEMKRNFGDLPEDDRAVVCDDCFRRGMAKFS